jgi:two-component system response regulator FixJ
MSYNATGRVYIVDSDPDFGLSVQWLLEKHQFPAEYFSDYHTFLQNYDGEMGCLMLDSQQVSVSGTSCLEHFSNQDLPLPVIMLSTTAEINDVVLSMRQGAVDYLVKPSDEHALLRAAKYGLQVGTERFAQYQKGIHVRDNYKALSRRERQVMTLVVEGFANREIAEQLGISPKTVEVHRSRVMSKMKANSLPDLVRYSWMLEGDDSIQLAS